jgi:membrane fusion protein (multidrug efflux system)
VAALLILILAISGLNRISEKNVRAQNSGTLVKIEKPQRLTVSYRLQYNGDVIADRQAKIFSKVSGSLERIFADIGDYVRQDQLLAVIDSTELFQQVLETAASFQNAKLNFQRTNELLDQNMVPKEDVDNARTAMQIAEANFNLAKTKLRYARITAPFAGYITIRNLDPGTLVVADNSILFTLMDMDRVKIVINVLEKDTPLIPRLRSASVVADALPDRPFDGIITRNSRAIDLATRTMAVEIEIANKDHVLKPGMFVTASLLYDEHPDAITVPTVAVLKDQEGNYVYVVDNKAAKRVPVQTGVAQDGRTEIITGLSGSEDVITTGQQFARDGGPVSIQK